MKQRTVVKNKKVVGVLMGGRSAEHEVSLRSAQTMIDHLPKSKYLLVAIVIDKQGKWWMQQDRRPVVLNPNTGQGVLLDEKTGQRVAKLDVLFPVLHGPYGEDGSIQGLAKLADLPCVGAGILGSAIGMDKDVMKRLLKAAGLAVCPFKVLHQHQSSFPSYSQLNKEYGLKMFVKPANMGSSLGISLVTSENEFKTALKKAFAYDRKVLIEKAIQGREFEIAIMGNCEPKISVAGEIVIPNNFYSYHIKYSDDSPSRLLIPAPISSSQLKKIQQVALKAYQVLEGRGMARVDLFLTDEGQIYINEINTIPGFTSVSMYPKLWAASGVPIRDLIDQLIMLAIDDYQSLHTS